MKQSVKLIALLLVTALLLCGCGEQYTARTDAAPQTVITEQTAQSTVPPQESNAPLTTPAQGTATLPPDSLKFDSAALPPFSGMSYVAVNGNVPYFTEADLTTEAFETYSELDALGRCGVTYANICRELMPTEPRGDIGQVKPTGWHTVKYDIVDGKYLYNRCHLIGFQLAGENANERNLITGTRYMNIEGMLPFENMVADFVKETGSHVLYRVTPIFTGENPVADGVLMEAMSVEDNGDGVLFCVFCYNIQPGVTIDYTTGESVLSGEAIPATAQASETRDYVLNTNTMKFHYPTCISAEEISRENRLDYTGTREELTEDGYSPCGNCKP